MVDEASIDRAAAAVLRSKFAAGLFDGAAFANPNASALSNTPAGRELARRIVSEEQRPPEK
jgi:beta-glucosidase-like glycosyl hydrolase